MAWFGPEVPIGEPRYENVSKNPGKRGLGRRILKDFDPDHRRRRANVGPGHCETDGRGPHRHFEMAKGSLTNGQMVQSHDAIDFPQQLLPQGNEPGEADQLL